MKKKIQRILIWIFELSLFCGYFYILFVNLVCGFGYGGISSRGQAIKILIAMGICPLEPRHVNSVSNPAKCSPDIPSEDLLID